MSICNAIPKLDKCCCCCPLRLGGLIIAAVILVFNILSLSGSISIIQGLDENDENYKSELWSEILLIGISSLDVLLSAFLFLGIIINKYHWLLPYLWVKGVLLLLGISLAIYTCFVKLWLGLSLLFSLLISLYWWMCLQSLYQDMK